MEEQNNPTTTNPTPPVHSILEPDKPVTTKSGSRLKKFILFLLMLIVLLGGAAGGIYAVAYNKVEIRNEKLQQQIAFLVQGLPYLPKTPEFLLAKTALVHQTTTKYSYQTSLTLKSDAISQGLGVTQLDFKANGGIDYSDPNNVITNTSVYLSNAPLLEAKMNGESVYFKVNSIPAPVLSILGLEKSTFDPISNKWVMYPLEKSAANSNGQNQPYVLSEDLINDIYNNFIDKELTDNITIEQTSKDNVAVYKLSLKADDKLTDHIGQIIIDNAPKDQTIDNYSSHLSSLLKNLNIEVNVDKNSYHLRDFTISGDISYYGDTADNFAKSHNTPPFLNFVLTSSFDNFGNAVEFNAPGEYISYDEFINRLNQITAQFGLYVGGNQIAQDDTTRISNLRTIQAALELYNTDCGQYPQQLSLLVGGSYCGGKNVRYLQSVPKDPNGEDFYYKLDNQGSYDLCANLSATPSADYNNCPNDSYNYHLISPQFNF